ncbi:imidazole glycerol phosphate synthase subunit HisH [Rarobacter faecitabidus]|uniref:Imidazole glycerol phosphate synthase subunit HisH n=1 Tax=Rarobacter faecitabidus TaxID=13243 RepID=A0A542ZW80_RARFA|nr:imidazole glycerol phosphate synthase subunit HisH [Rarobacter faecitabidus]TQL64601.1 glutamine amidotransferase [Rarobacter faecitabidus]
MASSVVVFDYGFGNVRSAVRALERVGAQVELSSDLDTAMAADGVVIPGVGAFAACASALRAARGDWVVERRLAGGRPVLGICVGMQIMFDSGIEHGEAAEGLAQWPGTVDRLEADVVPHMGWDTVDAPSDSVLFRGLGDERFYFVHSYAARSFPLSDEPVSSAAIRRPAVTWSDHGGRFVAAVENGPLSATQFHPEKSGDAGARLLENWLTTL